MNEKRYHHGDLKQQLIDRGVQLLAREGYEGFSMRKLAALCGVSHAAPYKHFAGKEEIILAISLRISEEFTRALSSAAERHPGQPRLQLIELGAEYVRFLSENPDYFRFVFMTDHGRPISVGPEGILSQESPPVAIARAYAESWFRPRNPDGWFLDFMSLWSMLHGLTLMLVSNTVHFEGDALDWVKELMEEYLK